MSIRVQPNVVFLEQVLEEETTENGIILTSTKRADNRARITDIHPETSDATGLEVGQTVLVNPYSVREIVIGAYSRLAVVPGDILAVIETEGET